ncbi:MAG: DUF6438 domain-containing protein [Bacteroidia bacterium]
MKLLMYSAIVLLLAPCNKPKQTTDSTPDYSKVKISYQTSACFGRCPVYKLTINGESKMATYIGEQNTERTGTFIRKVSDKEIGAFVDAFEKAKFSSMQNEYLGPITDFPIKVITYTNGDKSKTVKGRSQEPEELTNLEKMLNGFANEEGWKPSSDSGNSQD